MIYSIGEVYKNPISSKLQLIANLCNGKLYLYDIELQHDGGSAIPPVIKHTSEIKLFSNILTMLYE
jgi:hypothetical protein